MTDQRFEGFQQGAIQFLAELKENNNKEWFAQHKERYEDVLLGPAEAFVTEFGDALREEYPMVHFGTQRNGSGSIMRIYRDVRFSPDKRPYKENLGMVFWLGNGKKVEQPGFYVHLSPSEAFFYGGQYMFPKPVLKEYRIAVDDPTKGTMLESILADLDGEGLTLLNQPAYKRVPRGYPADHPRGDLLKYSGVGVSANISEKISDGAGLIGFLLDTTRKMRPLIEWLVEMNSFAQNS
ncbi:MAG: DUF2461 domain-containing protein [Bacteroidetes bacterium]|nr:DUF2461 domain-containing protein [Bacteroidota bacterium]